MLYTLDITKEHCPMTFVKTKLQLSRMKPGDILDVLLAEGEPLNNVPRTAKEEGHSILEIRAEGDCHRIRIEKR